MDIATLARLAAQAREFEVGAGGARFVLRLPTRFEQQLAFARSAAADGQLGAAGFLAGTQALLPGAIVRWAGVSAATLAPAVVAPGDADDQPVEHSPAAVALLLTERGDLAEELRKALFDRITAARAAAETLEKN
jgi:hypothetical protein